MPRRDQAVVQIDFAPELRTHLRILVITGRLESTVAEDEVAFLAERLEPWNQLRIVELVECGVNLAIVLLDAIEQFQQLWAQQAAQRIAQRVVNGADQIVEVGLIAD